MIQGADDLSLPDDPVLAEMITALREHPLERAVARNFLSHFWAVTAARCDWSKFSNSDAEALFRYMANTEAMAPGSLRDQSNEQFILFKWWRHGLLVQVSRARHPQATEIIVIANYDQPSIIL